MPKIDADPRPYRKGVGILLLNRRSEVFVGQRIDTRTDAWQLPQGGIDKGEKPRDAAFRELEEEIGTAKAKIIAESRDWLTYDLPPDLAVKVWKGRYRGQKQRWFAMRFLGKDKDIDVDTKHPEFSAWKWAALRDLPELIVPFKRELYRQVVEEFRGVVESYAGAGRRARSRIR